eukprot:m.206196 g.206196  ORF g.206196 m.206196 type:complete len:78 (+) comp39669_c2_seq3:33-266(+)
MEILQNEKSKEEKKQIPEVTDDFLESAIKSSKLIEELILQTSYASVSLISSVRNDFVTTIQQYGEWCEQLKSLKPKK